MKKVTYSDYLNYTKQMIKIEDTATEYKLEEIHQCKDKGFKIILEDKEEAVQFINYVLELENTQYAITKNEIERYHSHFITKDFKSKEADIVYKKNGEDIFFLIEQQSQIDYSMAYRILNYSIEIIRNAVKKEKLKNKGYKMPIVYPIVLYTGSRKWNARRYFEECQMKLKGLQKTTFTSYNLVDINNYTEEELWEQQNFLSKILLLEKAKQKDKIKEYLREIEKKALNDKEVNVLLKMVCGSIGRKIEEKEIEEFIRKMKNKRGGNSMLTALEEYFDNLIEEKMEKVETREKDIKVKEKDIKVKEKDIKVKEKDIKVKEKDIKVKEKDIKVKEKDIKVKQKKFQEKEKEFRQKEKVIATKEKILQDRENEINKLIEQEKKQNMYDIIKRMLRNSLNEKTILLMTEISKEELEEIKKE